jgi:hypothetical protein
VGCNRTEERNPQKGNAVVPAFTVICQLLAVLRARLAVRRAMPAAGYTTETVVVTALLVALAVAVVAIIAAKVLATAHGISTGGTGTGG